MSLGYSREGAGNTNCFIKFNPSFLSFNPKKTYFLIFEVFSSITVFMLVIIEVYLK